MSSIERIVAKLISAAPKPIPATHERICAIPDLYVTIKLDGVRTFLVCEGKEMWIYDMRGFQAIAPETQGCSPLGPTILDTEMVGGYYYVFDVLFVNGADVRHLPTLARLRRAKNHLPARTSLKRIYWGPSPSVPEVVSQLVRKRPKLADGSHIDVLEGFIFGSLAAAYDQVQLKYKFFITCDFTIASSCEDSDIDNMPVRKFNLFVQCMKKVVMYEGRCDVPSYVIISHDEASTWNLPTAMVKLEDDIILEMKLMGRHWQVVRRRYDRTRPNTRRTVQENIELHNSKCALPSLLCGAEQNASASLSVNHISNAMLRTVGVCGALSSIGAVNALFMPGIESLEKELISSTHSSSLAVITVLFRHPCQLDSDNDASGDALPLHHLIQLSKERGWKCKSIIGVRAHDFLAGHCSMLPQQIRCSLENAAFVLVTREPTSRMLT